MRFSWIILFSLWTADAFSQCSFDLTKLANLPKQGQEIDRFLSEFSAFTPTLPRHEWKNFFLQIAAFDFNKAPIPSLLVNKKFFKIEPYMILGWKAAGFIGADGKWNFRISRNQVLKNMADHLDGNVVSAGKDLKSRPAIGIDNRFRNYRIIQPHAFYIRSFRNREFVFEDLHDFIFHFPYFLDPKRISFLRWLASYDIVVNEKSGTASLMNLFFEYAGSDHIAFLRGPLQMVGSSIFQNYHHSVYRRVFSQFPEIRSGYREIDIHKIPALLENLQTRDLSRYPQGVFKDLVRVYGVGDDESLSYRLARLALRLELKLKLQSGEIEDRKIDQAQQLLQRL